MHVCYDQQIYTNVLKKFEARGLKVGNVRTVTDRTLKSSVMMISGSSPASNALHFPETNVQSLNLTDQFFYLLFKPIQDQYFVVHLDLISSNESLIRISVSNIFKEFKVSSKWIQFPFIINANGPILLTKETGPNKCRTSLPFTNKWIFLCLDLLYILSIYLNERFSFLKSIHLCANMLIKNIFTSNLKFDPEISAKEAAKDNLHLKGMLPLPMEFRIYNEEKWQDVFHFLCFPNKDNFSIFNHVLSNSVFLDSSKKQKIHQKPLHIKEKNKSEMSLIGKRDSLKGQTLRDCKQTKEKLPSQMSNQKEIVSKCTKPLNEDNIFVKPDSLGEIHIFTPFNQSLVVHRGNFESNTNKIRDSKITMSNKTNSDISEVEIRTIYPSETENSNMSPEAMEVDSRITLDTIIGFGGTNTEEVYLSDDYNSVIYPCFSTLILMNCDTRKQTFLNGHTNKISALSILQSSDLLVSAQTGKNGSLRFWELRTTECLAAVKTDIHFINCLEFAPSGFFLCGVGKDSYNKNLIVIWDTKNVKTTRTLSVISITSTDLDIVRLRVAIFDETRLSSCGAGNITLWKLCGRSLRYFPIDLGDESDCDFTDCRFQLNHPDNQMTECLLYVTNRKSCMCIIELSKLCIVSKINLLENIKKWAEEASTLGSLGDNEISNAKKESKNKEQRKNKMSPPTYPNSFNISNVSLNCFKIVESICVVGCSDAFIRAFPLDFSSLLLEVGHGDPVTAVDISLASGRILSATAEGNLGVLDVHTKLYKTLTRSHVKKIISVCCDSSMKNLISISSDHTIRIWDLQSYQQLYDYYTTNEYPSAVCCHPQPYSFACGYSDGSVKVFGIHSLSLLHNIRQHRAQIIGVVYSQDGFFMYTACSYGQLTMYSAKSNYTVIKVFYNMIMLGDLQAPEALQISDTNQLLAFVGPTKYNITLLRIPHLNDKQQIDLPTTRQNRTAVMESILQLRFVPDRSTEIFIVTSANRILRMDIGNRSILSQFSDIHQGACTAIELMANYLFTAGDSVIKIWDSAKPDTQPKIFIGHLESIQKLLYISRSNQLVSVGEAIFIWKFET